VIVVVVVVVESHIETTFDFLSCRCRRHLGPGGEFERNTYNDTIVFVLVIYMEKTEFEWEMTPPIYGVVCLLSIDRIVLVSDETVGQHPRGHCRPLCCRCC
jgi:hypothetical protein